MLRPPAVPAFRPPRRGFTLIELLTVIAIVGILAGILIPTVGLVRKNARLSALASNLRTVSSCVHLYAQDNKGKTPPTSGAATGSGDPSSWQQRVKPYFDDKQQTNVSRTSLLHDPLDDAEYLINGTTRYSWNIAINGFSGYDGTTGILGAPMGAANRLVSTVGHPSRLMLLTTGQSGGDAYTGYVMRVRSGAYLSPNDPAQLTRVPGRHYVAFFDTHVEVLTAERMAAEATLDQGYRSVLFDRRADNASQ